MVAEAKARGLELTGPNGLLKLSTKNMLETVLNEELTEHLGYPNHQAEPGRVPRMYARSRSKTVISDAVAMATDTIGTPPTVPGAPHLASVLHPG